MGLRASGPVSRICMDIWVKKFIRRLEELRVRLRLAKKYVDDVLTVAHNLPLGSRYTNNTITVTQETHNQDNEANLSCEEVTMNVLKEVA